MEYALLTQVGFAVGLFVKTGYAVAVGYGVKTVFRYVSDYKESVSNDRGVL